MFKYIAFAWNPYDLAQTASVCRLHHSVISSDPSWRTVLDVRGLRVLCSRPTPSSNNVHVLAEGLGVLLGTAFPTLTSSCSPNGPKFHTSPTKGITTSDLRELCARYWGRYVCFAADIPRGTTYVLRSPTGELDCLEVRLAGVHVFFSSTASPTVLSWLKVSINWDYVAAEACAPVHDAHETGLSEVARVLNGECVQIRQGRTSRSFYWHPAQIARGDTIENASEAAAILRATARACVHAWASCYESILETLSGGLDSAIVLSSLNHAPSEPEITCINYYSPTDPSTDERYFARLAARHRRCRLLEHEITQEIHLEQIFDTAKGVTPDENVYALRIAEVARSIAREAKAQACFSGLGGDQVFFQNGAKFAYADYFARYGFGFNTLRMALSTARLEGDTIWRVLARSERSPPITTLLSGLDAHLLISRETLAHVRERRLFVHPWLDHCRDLPPGKWWHVWLLSTVSGSKLYESAGMPESVAPLVSQPLVELCLRLPSYILTFEGQDRALARHAFHADVPAEILNRRAKARTYDSAKSILRQNIRFIRGALLDGALVKQGILDRKIVEETLGDEVKRISEHATRVLRYVTLEAWIARWSATQRIRRTEPVPT